MQLDYWTARSESQMLTHSIDLSNNWLQGYWPNGNSTSGLPSVRGSEPSDVLTALVDPAQLLQQVLNAQALVTFHEWTRTRIGLGTPDANPKSTFVALAKFAISPQLLDAMQSGVNMSSQIWTAVPVDAPDTLFVLKIVRRSMPHADKEWVSNALTPRIFPIKRYLVGAGPDSAKCDTMPNGEEVLEDVGEEHVSALQRVPLNGYCRQSCEKDVGDNEQIG
ncbi:hypothetical protein C8R45DRAFT_945612 [Mycena sanguinolenta]|nr:hypothetical protein C8R45DRAFT_945612 [Mycena sanguinolenta]